MVLSPHGFKIIEYLVYPIMDKNHAKAKLNVGKESIRTPQFLGAWLSGNPVSLEPDNISKLFHGQIKVP